MLTQEEQEEQHRWGRHWESSTRELADDWGVAASRESWGRASLRAGESLAAGGEHRAGGELGESWGRAGIKLTGRELGESWGEAGGELPGGKLGTEESQGSQSGSNMVAFASTCRASLRNSLQSTNDTPLARSQSGRGSL